MRHGLTRGLAALTLGLSTAASANDLLDSYQRALDRDAVLQAAYYQRRVSIEARPQALAALLPRLDANVGYFRDRQIVASTPSFVTDPTAPPSSTTEGRFLGNTLNYGLTLTQTIWNFESFFRLRETNLLVAQAEAVFRSAQQNLILRVARAYFAVLGAADTLRTNQLARAAFGALFTEARHRVETGIAARTDLQEAQSFYDATAAGIIDAETTLEDARRALAELTMRYPDRIEAFQDEIPLIAPTPAETDAWVDSALQSNFDLAALDLRADAAQREINVNRAHGLPRLQVQGGIVETKASASFGGDQRDERVGLVLDWPILQGGLVLSQVRQAKAAYQQARADYEVQRRAVERQTRNSFRGVVSGIARVKAAEQSVASNKAALDASQVGLEVGTRTEFDVLNAQTNYYAALRIYYQTRYDYLTNVLTLKQLAGRLTEADLADIDRLLVPGSDAAAPANPESSGSPFHKTAARVSGAGRRASADAVRNLRLLKKIPARSMIWA